MATMTPSVDVGTLELTASARSRKESFVKEVASEARAVGELVDPKISVVEDQSAFAIELPENIISIVIVTTLTSPQASAVSLFQLYYPLAATLAVQFIVAMSLQKSVNQEAGVGTDNDLSGTCGTSNCDPVDMYVVGACLCLFIGVCFGDAKQNLDIVHWLRTFEYYAAKRNQEKTAPQAEQLKFQKYESSHRGMQIEYFVPASRLTSIQSVSFSLMVVLQWMVTLFTLWYGSLTIVYAKTNLNVILNSVALQFVLDLDEIAAKVFADSYSKSLLKAIPPISVAELRALCSGGNVAQSGLDVRVLGPVFVVLAGIVLQSVVFTQENGFQCGGKDFCLNVSAGCTCLNTCSYPNDFACDDGGPGSEYEVCSFGSDCADCGIRCANNTLS